MELARTESNPILSLAGGARTFAHKWRTEATAPYE
ncbi:hypothetical protein LINPERHAP1_LOCUS15116 [Linum perenne]